MTKEKTTQYKRKSLIRKTRTKKHGIQMFFLRFIWWAEAVHLAVKNQPEVRKYKYMRKMRDATHKQYLELQRKDPKNNELPFLEGKLDVLNHLINYDG